MNIFRRHILSIPAAVLVFALSVMPTSSLPQVTFQGADKLVHIFMYAALTGAIFLDRRILQHRTTSGGYFITFIFVAVYGLMMEFFQFLLPWRSFSMLDVLANCVGSLIGILLYRLFLKIFAK